MVIVFPPQVAVTPAGKPVGVPMPVAPVVLCVIGVREVLIQTVGNELWIDAVLLGFTVNNLVAVAFVPKQFPVPLTVYVIKEVPEVINEHKSIR